MSTEASAGAAVGRFATKLRTSVVHFALRVARGSMSTAEAVAMRAGMAALERMSAAGTRLCVLGIITSTGGVYIKLVNRSVPVCLFLDSTTWSQRLEVKENVLFCEWRVWRRIYIRTFPCYAGRIFYISAQKVNR